MKPVIPFIILPASAPNVGRMNPGTDGRLDGMLGTNYAADPIVAVTFCAADAARNHSCSRLLINSSYFPPTDSKTG